MRWIVDISIFFALGIASLPNTVLGEMTSDSYFHTSRLFLTFFAKLSQIIVPVRVRLQVPHHHPRVLHQARRRPQVLPQAPRHHTVAVLPLLHRKALHPFRVPLQCKAYQHGLVLRLHYRYIVRRRQRLLLNRLRKPTRREYTMLRERIQPHQHIVSHQPIAHHRQESLTRKYRKLARRTIKMLEPTM